MLEPLLNHTHPVGNPAAPPVANQIQPNAAPPPANFLTRWTSIATRSAQSVVHILGHRYTKILAGVILIAAASSAPFIGPGCVPIFAVSGALFLASTAASLPGQAQTGYGAHIVQSVGYYAAPTLAVISVLFPITFIGAFCIFVIQRLVQYGIPHARNTAQAVQLRRTSEPTPEVIAEIRGKLAQLFSNGRSTLVVNTASHNAVILNMDNGADFATAETVEESEGEWIGVLRQRDPVFYDLMLKSTYERIPRTFDMQGRFRSQPFSRLRVTDDMILSGEPLLTLLNSAPPVMTAPTVTDDLPVAGSEIEMQILGNG